MSISFRYIQPLYLIFESLFSLILLFIQTNIYFPLISFYRQAFQKGTIYDYDQESKRKIEIEILYHNAHYLIINKPHEINLTDQTRCTMTDYQSPNIESILQKRFPSYKLRNVHRLDYATSGILCYALNKKAAAEASVLFHNREVEKTYLALVRGHLKTNDFIINQPIGKDLENFSQMKINGHQAKPSETRVILLDCGYYGNIPVSLVELHPKSGRKHQLRVHTAHIGHPIIGDLTYEEQASPSSRMMLHAWKIELNFQYLNPSRELSVSDLFKKPKGKSESIRSNFLWRLSRVLKGVYDYYQSFPNQTNNLVIATENPFCQYINSEPEQLKYDTDIFMQRMGQFSWFKEKNKHKIL